MKTVPGYPKIWSLSNFPTGHWGDPLAGEVVVQEKVDGSQFGWGVNEDGVLVFRSKGVADIEGKPADQFAGAIGHLGTAYGRWGPGTSMWIRDCYFYGEVLARPKHNVLAYGRVPTGNIVLFDGLCGGKWLDRHQLEDAADILGIDLVPEHYRGPADRFFLNDLLDRESYLGAQTQEGIVVKNYGVEYEQYGHTFPAFMKLVRDDFKEAHAKEWKVRQGSDDIAALGDALADPVRWQKAVYRLRDQGELTSTPADIGKLFALVNADLDEEEGEGIRQKLYELNRKTIFKHATKGIPDWYKAQLAVPA